MIYIATMKWLLYFAMIAYFLYKPPVWFANIMAQMQLFDKLLLTGLVLYFSLLGLNAFWSYRGTDPLFNNFMTAMLDNQKLVIGALLGLITGRALGKADSAVESVTTIKETSPPPESPTPVAPIPSTEVPAAPKKP